MKKRVKKICGILCIIAILMSFTVFTGCDSQKDYTDTTVQNLTTDEFVVDTTEETELSTEETEENTQNIRPTQAEDIDIEGIPEYSGKAYVAINGNVPAFTNDEMSTESYEYYGDLDYLGRCTVTVACIGRDIMPTEDRGDIGQVKPTGWHTVKYDCVDGKYLYNRCHLIGFQLTGENANEENLVTGTRYMNVDGMLPFENMVADYVKETGNHVMYKVVPVFEDDDLLCKGVHMQAYSVEDEGDGISFNVFCYNVQPGVDIDYSDGTSVLGETEAPENINTKPYAEDNKNTEISSKYILNTNSKKFHYSSCSAVDRMSESNKQEYSGSRQDLINRGYDPCKLCNP